MSPARYAWDQSRLLRMCLSDFRAVHHSQELHLCPSLSQPCSSPYRRAAAVTYTVGTPTEMTSAAYARTLAGLRTLSQRDRGGAGHVVRALRKAMALTIPKRTCWHSAPMMKIITGAEAGRRRGVRRRNQTPRDSNNTFHPHRWMIARHGAGRQGSWQREPQRQGRRHHRPPRGDFLMPPPRPRLLPRPKGRWKGMCPVQR